jgi:hypothetical protein
VPTKNVKLVHSYICVESLALVDCWKRSVVATKLQRARIGDHIGLRVWRRMRSSAIMDLQVRMQTKKSPTNFGCRRGINHFWLLTMPSPRQTIDHYYEAPVETKRTWIDQLPSSSLAPVDAKDEGGWGLEIHAKASPQQ